MQAAIFDMDGILIDSEPLWRRAERKIFAGVGVDLTKDMCIETMGLRLDEVVRYWHQRFPWEGKAFRDIEDQIISTMDDMISEEGKALPGVYEILESLHGAGLKLGIASSSPLRLIDVVVKKLDILNFFHVRCSADEDANGKPDPAVYIRAADRLSVDPSNCFVFEDSLWGLRSAKAAGMTVVAVPASEQYGDPRFNEADFKIKSLKDFSFDMLGSSK